MSTELSTIFNAREIGRLERLQERFRSGKWPRPVRELSLSDVYPVEMTFTRARNDRGVQFDCQLMHAAPEHAMAPIRVRFQSPDESDSPPTADEVLQWLALGAVAPANSGVDPLATLFYVMQTDIEDQWWRGPSIDAESVEDFRTIMSNYGAQIRQLLGPGATADLVASLTSS